MSSGGVVLYTAKVVKIYIVNRNAGETSLPLFTPKIPQKYLAVVNIIYNYIRVRTYILNFQYYKYMV